MAFWNRNNPQKLRVIKTARNKFSINRAAKKGFKLILKKVEPSSEIHSKYCVVQNKKTGRIKVLGDYRSGLHSDKNEEFITVIDWTYYYPHSFISPFAAYLIPKDIVVGERVFVKDLIEDFVGKSWNQGDTYRLESCEAIWNGSDLEIQYERSENCSSFVG